MGKHKNHKRGNLLPFATIEAAARGDVTAINQVLKHYEGYVIALSTKRLFDERGKPYMVVDTEMRRTLETTLITRILQFDVRRAA
ncbi:MAG: helix-turn-helix domain-containing protein [Defluviitaleaceae bacterium]|nr:helix-turn-helix domain-containing protein [Defluviitaleaceae bacterium]MCL2263900.1 helix-turn-helix domain-containing protein [Defluviitaleaceae bacterium]